MRAEILHPARQYSFDDLVAGLHAAEADGMVKVSSDGDLRLFCYPRENRVSHQAASPVQGDCAGAPIKTAAALEARNRDLYDRIRQLVRDGDFPAIDAMLSPGDHTGATRPEMLGLLRYTRGHRHQLPAWHPFLAAVHVELSSRGLNAADILAGLS